MREYLKDRLALLKLKLAGARRSLTVLFNALAGVVVVALPDLVAVLPQLQESLPEQPYKYLAALLILGNVLIRARTNKALEAKA